MKHTSLEVGDAVYPAGRRRDDSDIRKGGKPWGIVVGVGANIYKGRHPYKYYKRDTYTVMWNHGRSHSKHMRHTLVKKEDLESYPRFSRWYDGTVCRNTVTNAWYSNRINIRDDFSTPMQRRPGIYDEVELGLSMKDFFVKIDNIDQWRTNFIRPLTSLRKQPSQALVSLIGEEFPRPEPMKEWRDFSNPFKEHRAQLDSFLSKHSRRKR